MNAAKSNFEGVPTTELEDALVAAVLDADQYGQLPRSLSAYVSSYAKMQRELKSYVRNGLVMTREEYADLERSARKLRAEIVDLCIETKPFG